MNNDNVIALPAVETTETFNDALTQLVRQGARQIIACSAATQLLDRTLLYTCKKARVHCSLLAYGF